MTLFSAHMDAHRDRLLRAAYGFLRNRSLAEEACQDAFLKAFEARASYDDTQPFYPWLYRILKNTCLDALRKKKRQPQVSSDVEHLFDSHSLSPEEATCRKEDASILMAAMASLDESYAEVINLRHLQELSYAEIAACLSVKEGTVMSRLYRARKALAASIAAQSDDATSTRKTASLESGSESRAEFGRMQKGTSK